MLVVQEGWGQGRQPGWPAPPESRHRDSVFAGAVAMSSNAISATVPRTRPPRSRNASASARHSPRLPAAATVRWGMNARSVRRWGR